MGMTGKRIQTQGEVGERWENKRMNKERIQHNKKHGEMRCYGNEQSEKYQHMMGRYGNSPHTG